MQQQQSNPVKPQKVGGAKKGLTMKKKMTKKSMPSMLQVQKSVAKTMGY